MMGASANGVLIKAPNFSHPLESNPPLPQTAQLRASIESDTPFLAVPPVRGQRQGAPSQDQVFATPELVENVLSFLDERDLARCALVGRTWRVPATVFLWRRWSIDLKREDQRRLHVFTSMTPAIRSLVRPLRAELTAGNNDRERRYFSEVGDALRHVAPFVRDWAVDCLAPDLFAVWTVHVIPAGENVVRLRLYNWPPIAAVWINPLLLRCPNFRLLSLSEFTGDVNLPPDLPYLHSLKIAERIPSLVEFDKISRYGNLTRLFVAKIQKREELEALARLSGLTHLLIPYCSVEWDEGLYAMLEKIGFGLEALDLSTSRLDSRALTPTTIQNIFTLCPKLEQLSLDDYAGTSIAAATLLFLHLPRLRSLSMLGERITSDPFDRALAEEVVMRRDGPEMPIQFWFNSDQDELVMGCRPTAEGVYADWATSYNWTMFQTRE